MLTLNSEELSKWFNDNGDQTHNLDYPLTEDSIVMDLGGFKGIWASQIINLYNPNVYIIEPIYDYHNYMVNKFADNNKVKLMNVGVSDEDKEDIIFINADSSSFNSDGTAENVKLLTMESIFNKWNLKKVDLLQINIEGGEYLLLENMLETGSINKFKNIQIQFHLGVENDIERRFNIQEGLSKNDFKIKFEYPFVWESWGK
jgi:FkbM family methyltransferase